jgi:putative transposase
MKPPWQNHEEITPRGARKTRPKSGQNTVPELAKSLSQDYRKLCPMFSGNRVPHLPKHAKKQGLSPKRIITDKLRSYEAAKRQVMPDVEHRSHKGLNNRAENSHLPFRKRERMRQGFRSIGNLQHFVSLFSAVRNLFVPDHTKPSATQIRNHRLHAMAQWKAVSGQLV